MIQHIWCCECGAETDCAPEDMRTGAVFRCPHCKQVWGGVQPKRGGGPKWIPISEDLVEFHNLLDEGEDDD